MKLRILKVTEKTIIVALPHSLFPNKIPKYVTIRNPKNIKFA